MEQHNISFDKGLSRMPFSADDGELDECVNLIPSKGGLGNIMPPEDLGVGMPGGYTLRYVHVTANYTHYIGCKEGTGLCWRDSKDRDAMTGYMTADGTVTDIGSVGNTLIVLTDRGRLFFLFEDGRYNPLGGLPDIEASFSLRAEKPVLDPYLDKVTDGMWNHEIHDLDINCDRSHTDTQDDANLKEQLKGIKEAFYAATSFMRETAYRHGLFVYPFKICCVLTFFDDTPARITAPVLLAPSCYRAFLEIFNSRKDDDIPYCDLSVAACRLFFRAEVTGDLTPWKDILKSVSFYITKPFQTLKETADDSDFELDVYKVHYEFHNTLGVEGPFSILNENSVVTVKYWETQKGETVPAPEVEPVRGIYCTAPDPGGDGIVTLTFDVGTLKRLLLRRNNGAQLYEWIAFFSREENLYHSRETVGRRLMEDASFYFLGSLDVRDLETGKWLEVPGVEDTLPTIENQKKLDTGFLSGHGMVPGGLFVYNGRVNYYDIRKELFGGYRFFTSLVGKEKVLYRTYVYLKDNDGNRATVSRDILTYGVDGWYFFYPDSGAWKAVMERYPCGGDGTPGELSGRLELKLVRHPLMDAAYFFGGFPGSADETVEKFSPRVLLPPVSGTEGYGRSVNRLYTSEADNPFSVNAANVNTVGSGRILALAANTAALSQGQFGQHPLYVFCTDGIYAMSVGASGTFSAVHPVSRDVCANPDAVVQTDHSVIFVSARGLMALQGSETALLSGVMDGTAADPSPCDVMEGFSDLFVKDTEGFAAMLRGCRIAYDYAHSLLHIFPAGSAKHYVYSTESGAFSSFAGRPVEAAVRCWPHDIIQSGGRLFGYGRYDEPDTLRRGMFVTRPVPFGNPLAVKVLADLRMLYSRLSPGSSCRVAVWVSNDLRTWRRLKSLRAGAFRWYRFAVFTSLTDGDVIAGMACMTEERRTERIR